jgi:putative serine protease PepD
MPATLRPSRTAATLSAALLLGAGGGAAAATAVDGGSSSTHVVTAAVAEPASSTSGALTVNGVYRNVRQGVVDITVANGSGKAEGSGFVIDRSGDIVTNQHVVSGGGSILVRFADGTKASAKPVGADSASDIAVVRVSGVDSSKLQPLTFADSSKVAVGDGAIAIGSPYGLKNSLSVGVVSALGRSIAAPNHFTIAGAIQTDAAINHGNSGGPLLDSQGNVVGVNAQIESNNGENTGVGFAIPSNTVRTVAEDIVAGTKVQHASLGVQLTDAEAGPTVAAVTNGGAAAGAGVQNGDVVTGVDGHPVSSTDQLVAAIQSHQPGEHVTLTVHRSGSTRNLSVTLGAETGS